MHFFISFRCTMHFLIDNTFMWFNSQRNKRIVKSFLLPSALQEQPLLSFSCVPFQRHTISPPYPSHVFTCSLIYMCMHVSIQRYRYIHTYVHIHMYIYIKANKHILFLSYTYGSILYSFFDTLLFPNFIKFLLI